MGACNRLSTVSLLCVEIALLNLVAIGLTIGQAQELTGSVPRGTFVPRKDHSFLFASTDASMKGLGFHLQSNTSQEVTGTVFDENREPVSGAEVWFSGYYGCIPIRERSTTDQDGSFSLKLPMDQELGKVQWSTYAIHQNRVSGLVQQVNGSVEYSLVRGRRLSVRAMDGSQGQLGLKPIPDFFLHLQDGRILTCDSTGVCNVSGLVPEVQYVLVTSPGFAPFRAMVDLYEDREFDLVATLALGGFVEGQVVDKEQQPVPFNPVNTWTCERSLFTVGHSTTDAKGYFNLSGIPLEKPVDVETFSHQDGPVTYSEQETITLTSKNEKKSIRFQVNPNRDIDPRVERAWPMLAANQEKVNGQFSGVVRLPDGRACENFKLRIFPSTKVDASGSWAASYGSIGITFQSPDGSFVFSGLPVDSGVRAVISAKGYCDATVDPVKSLSRGSQDSVTLHEFVLKPEVIPRIKVTDENGREIQSAAVELHRSRPGQWINSYERPRSVSRGSTDGQGLAVLPASPIENGRVVVVAKGFGEQQFDWIHSETKVLQLQATHTLKIQVRLEDPVEATIELSLMDESGRSSFRSGNLQFKDGIAIWEASEIKPGRYRVVASGPDDARYRATTDDKEREIINSLDLSGKPESPQSLQIILEKLL